MGKNTKTGYWATVTAFGVTGLGALATATTMILAPEAAISQMATTALNAVGLGTANQLLAIGSVFVAPVTVSTLAASARAIGSKIIDCVKAKQQKSSEYQPLVPESNGDSVELKSQSLQNGNDDNVDVKDIFTAKVAKGGSFFASWCPSRDKKTQEMSPLTGNDNNDLLKEEDDDDALIAAEQQPSAPTL